MMKHIPPMNFFYKRAQVSREKKLGQKTNEHSKKFKTETQLPEKHTMLGSLPMKTTKYYNLNGYDPVIEVITDIYSAGNLIVDVGRYRTTFEYIYKAQPYQSLQHALNARQRDVDEDNKETYGFHSQEIKHPEAGKETIYQHTLYKITYVKGIEKHRELVSDVYKIHNLQFSTLQEAKQKRKLIADTKIKHDQVNEYNALAVKMKSGSESIELALHAIGLLKDIIKSNPSSEYLYAPQLKVITLIYEAEKLAFKAQQLETKLAQISVDKHPAEIQKIKDFYAAAIELKTAKTFTYKEKRAAISLEKVKIEKQISHEHELHEKAKAAAKKASNTPINENYEFALRKYDELITLESPNIDAYKAERRVIFKNSEQLRAESNLHQETLKLSRLANSHPSVENYQQALRKYDELIALESKNIDAYKAERRVIFKNSEQLRAESNLHQEALRLSRLTNSHPSVENYQQALRKYDELIAMAIVKTNYQMERAQIDEAKRLYFSQQQDHALNYIRNLRVLLSNQNPQQRLVKHQEIIHYCQSCNLGLNLQLFINESRQAIAVEQNVLNDYAQAQEIMARIHEFSDDSRLEKYQQIINKLDEIILANTPEKNQYQRLKNEIEQAKSNYQIQMQQNIRFAPDFDLEVKAQAELIDLGLFNEMNPQVHEQFVMHR